MEDRNTYGGGIIIAVRRKYIASPVKIEYENEDENPELYWIKIDTIKNQKSIYICGLYRSQRDIRSANTIECLRESLQKLPGCRGQHHIIITGDINLHIDWSINVPQNNSQTKHLDVKLIKICDDYNLEQKVNFPTRLENTLDIFCTNDPSKVINIRPSPPLEDHNGIVADINLNPKQKSKSQHLIYNWKKANIEDMNEEVISKLDSINFSEENIHENWENFKKILTDARDKFVPSKLSTTRHNLPWYNQKLRRLAKKKQRLFNKAIKKSKTKDDTKQFKACHRLPKLPI